MKMSIVIVTRRIVSRCCYADLRESPAGRIGTRTSSVCPRTPSKNTVSIAYIIWLYVIPDKIRLPQFLLSAGT